MLSDSDMLRSAKRTRHKSLQENAEGGGLSSNQFKEKVKAITCFAFSKYPTLKKNRASSCDSCEAYRLG